MQRVTITLDDELMGELDRLIERRGYANRSEAIRDLTRLGFGELAASGEGDERDCVGTLVYVYDHGARELAKRLTRHSHAHHHLTVSTLHVHLDHDSCLEVSVLKGRGKEVRGFAEEVIAERSVRHGRLVLVPGGETAGGNQGDNGGG